MYLDKTPYLLALEVEGAAGVLIIYRSTSPVGSKVQIHAHLGNYLMGPLLPLHVMYQCTVSIHGCTPCTKYLYN